MRPGDGLQAEALPVVRPVPPLPEERWWPALQSIRERKSDADGDVDDDEPVDYEAKVGGPEDAQIEEEQRCACPCVGELVSDRCKVEGLQGRLLIELFGAKVVRCEEPTLYAPIRAPGVSVHESFPSPKCAPMSVSNAYRLNVMKQLEPTHELPCRRNHGHELRRAVSQSSSPKLQLHLPRLSRWTNHPSQRRRPYLST